MMINNIRAHTPEHNCQENKALRIEPEGDSYWYCEICFEDLGDAGPNQFSNIRISEGSVKNAL